MKSNKDSYIKNILILLLLLISVSTNAYDSSNYGADSSDDSKEIAYGIFGGKKKADDYFNKYYKLTNSISSGNFKKVKLLIKEIGVEAKVPYEGSFESPLVHAVKSNNLQITEYLLKEGADPNRYMDVYNSRTTALMDAASLDDSSQIVKLLLNYGADVNAIDREGKNALFYAFFIGRDKKTISILLPISDLNKAILLNDYLHPSDATILTVALQYESDEESINLLLRYGATAGETDASKLEFIKAFVKYISRIKNQQKLYDYSEIAFSLIKENQHSSLLDYALVYFYATLYENAIITGHKLSKEEMKEFQILAEKSAKAFTFMRMFQIIEASQNSNQDTEIKVWKKFAINIKNEWGFCALQSWARKFPKNEYPYVIETVERLRLLVSKLSN